MVSRVFVAVRPPAEVRMMLEALRRPEDPRVRWVPPHQWHVTLRFWPDGDPDVISARLDRAAASGELSVVQARFGPSVERLGPSAIVLPVAGLDDLAAAVFMATMDDVGSDGGSDTGSDGGCGDGSDTGSGDGSDTGSDVGSDTGSGGASGDERGPPERSGARQRFRGHLTLGRFRGRPRRHTDAPLIGTAIVPELGGPEFDVPEFDVPEFDVPEFDVPEFDVPEIELVESELGPAGATHRVIGTWALSR